MFRVVVCFVALASTAMAQDAPIANRPKVAGKMSLNLRERKEAGGKVAANERKVEWAAAKTAIIVIDMWDDHYCKMAAQRVGVMAPKMNAVLSAARSHGVMIIHAPSGCMDKYEGTPYRERMKQAPLAKAPAGWDFKWCYLDPKREPELPIDTSKCPCDDAVVGERVRKYTREHVGLDICGFDGVSDSGQEIFNFLTAEGIDNVVIMGVHTNMCVLGRPFGIRALTGLGKKVVLARDLTDAMYDPRQPPFVSHARGTELVIEHIERYWCPSVLSKDLMEVTAGSAGP
jgi:nicotinamidase-related amidase